MAYDVAASPADAGVPTILVVGGDDVERGRFSDVFGGNGFLTIQVDGPEAADAVMGQQAVDLVVLDERSFGARAYSFCRSSAVSGRAPVILLSGTSDTISQIVALEVGADEVIAADVDCRLLLARARAMLRRSRVQGPAPRPRGEGRWSLDPQTHIATGPDGGQVELARHQARLMQFFLDRPGTVVTTTLIANEDAAFRMEPTAFRTAISRLRRRLAQIDGAEFVRIVRGSGYVHLAAPLRGAAAN
jgi:DNA-binding response OmpR family regulator